ncbi:hypothetical protein ACXR2T_07775 [Leucobacter sp. HY1910]
MAPRPAYAVLPEVWDDPERMLYFFQTFEMIAETPVLKRRHGWFLNLHTGRLKKPVTTEQMNALILATGYRPPLMRIFPLERDDRGRVSKSSMSWVYKAILVARFVREHERIPQRPHGASARELEPALAQWLQAQRSVDLSPLRGWFLDRVAPSWRTPKDFSPSALLTARRIAATRSDLVFIDIMRERRHERRDSPFAWFMDAQMGSSRADFDVANLEALFSEREAPLPILQAFPIGALNTGAMSQRDIRWANRALDFVEFLSMNRRRPKRDSMHPWDASLAEWAHDLLLERGRGTLDPLRWYFLDSLMPDWFEGRPHESQVVRAEQIVEYVREYRRWPERETIHQRVGTRALEEDRVLYHYLAYLRKVDRDGTIDPDARDVMERAFGPAWRSQKKLLTLPA